MNTISNENRERSRISNKPENEIVSETHHRTIPNRKTQDETLQSRSRTSANQQPRRVKISPPRPEEMDVRDQPSNVLEQEESRQNEESDFDLEKILVKGRKVASLSKKLPEVLRIEDQPKKERITVMLESDTWNLLQKLKNTREIKSISGLVEIALNEFFDKYQLLK